MVICPDEMIRRRLRCGVRRVRSIGSIFPERCIILAQRAIDLVSRNVMEAVRPPGALIQPNLARRLQKLMGSKEICLDECVGTMN
jgi:hypothetical protein